MNRYGDMSEGEKRDFSRFVSWGFMSLLSASATVAVIILNSMQHSIAELNTKVALVISQSAQNNQDIKEMMLELKKNSSKIIILETKINERDKNE